MPIAGTSTRVYASPKPTYMIIAHAILAGCSPARGKYMRMDTMPIMNAPIFTYGRILPALVRVLSTITPMRGSVIMSLILPTSISAMMNHHELTISMSVT